MEECAECKAATQTVLDHATGDIICTECALVLESHFIDDTPEWRSFTNDDSKDIDPVRVERATTTSTLLAKCDLSTVISLTNGIKADSLPASLSWKKNRGPNSDQSLTNGFTTIAYMVDTLGLVSTIKFRAIEIYNKVQDQKASRGRNHVAILAACLYVACQQENHPRTIKEILTVTNGATMKELLRAKKYVVKQLGVGVEIGHAETGTLHAGDFLRRFCSNLGMNNQSVKAAQETVQKIDKMDIRRIPTSVAAAVIYIITRLSKEKKPILLRDVSIATGVAEGTIRSTYKDLYPHVSTIIPSWFANKVDLKSLLNDKSK